MADACAWGFVQTLSAEDNTVTFEAYAGYLASFLAIMENALEQVKMEFQEVFSWSISCPLLLRIWDACGLWILDNAVGLGSPVHRCVKFEWGYSGMLRVWVMRRFMLEYS